MVKPYRVRANDECFTTRLSRAATRVRLFSIPRTRRIDNFPRRRVCSRVEDSWHFAFSSGGGVPLTHSLPWHSFHGPAFLQPLGDVSCPGQRMPPLPPGRVDNVFWVLVGRLATGRPSYPASQLLSLLPLRHTGISYFFFN